MGQYYRIVVGEKDGMGDHVYDASKYVDESGEGRDLMEESFLNTPG